ncbi:MAG TPA: SDR family oxidoreductase [Gemmatimonadales bacterium]|nr:SDR family oxidoreductase [Gemmatimonadales bacterium]
MTAPGLAVVTGASAGIGREFAEQLAARGYDLLTVARDAGRLAEQAAALGPRYGVRVEPLAADLSREDGIGRVAERIAVVEPTLLVNNAGFGTTGMLARTDPGRQAEMVLLHTLAPLRLTLAALPALVRRNAGGVINVSSVASFLVSPGTVTYCATKSYLTVWSEGLAIELKQTGVRVQALCPGFTYSEFHERMGARRRRAPAFMWLSARTVVTASLRALDRRGPTVCIPGWQYRAIVGALRLLPRGLVGRLTYARERAGVT